MEERFKKAMGEYISNINDTCDNLLNCLNVSENINLKSKKCFILRNKIIDRFIRKSNRINNQIDKNKNCYLSKFIHENRVIYSILYDDVSYPENAVKIMSDNILKNTNM